MTPRIRAEDCILLTNAPRSWLETLHMDGLDMEIGSVLIFITDLTNLNIDQVR